MAIEKKSLIGKRTAAKKAVVASNATTSKSRFSTATPKFQKKAALFTRAEALFKAKI